VRRVRHRLHAPGHDDLELAGPDQLVGQRDRVQSGQADLVHGDPGRGHRDARGDRGLARRDLPGAGLQHLTHDDVLDLLGPHAAALEGGRDGVPAQRRGRDILEVAEQAAHRGSGAADDHGAGHD
jgi:hypothetical protein